MFIYIIFNKFSENTLKAIFDRVLGAVLHFFRDEGPSLPQLQHQLQKDLVLVRSPFASECKSTITFRFRDPGSFSTFRGTVWVSGRTRLRTACRVAWLPHSICSIRSVN